MNALDVTDLVKEYPDAEGKPPRRVLDGVALSVAPGEAVAIVGPSGCGKSTLLNLIGLLDAPTSGHIRLAGKDVAGLGENDRAALRAEHLGFVFQLHHLLPQCTVLENVLVPTLALPASSETRRQAPETARELLAAVGLSALAGKFPAQLSGGERQRVAVVRALVNRPQLVLADEPTGALDQANAAAVRDVLVRLAKERGAALIVVTHDAGIAASLDRVVKLGEGGR